LAFCLDQEIEAPVEGRTRRLVPREGRSAAICQGHAAVTQSGIDSATALEFGTNYLVPDVIR
jgi:hypothetical protein